MDVPHSEARHVLGAHGEEAVVIEHVGRETIETFVDAELCVERGLPRAPGGQELVGFGPLLGRQGVDLLVGGGLEVIAVPSHEASRQDGFGLSSGKNVVRARRQAGFVDDDVELPSENPVAEVHPDGHVTASRADQQRACRSLVARLEPRETLGRKHAVIDERVVEARDRERRVVRRSTAGRDQGEVRQYPRPSAG